MNRYRNGRFKSKRDAELQRTAILYATTMIFSTVMLFMQPWTATYQSLAPQQVQAYNGEICGLTSVICEGEETELEKRIQKAIAEIPHQSSTTEKWIRYIYEYADKVGGDADRASHLIYCESMFYCEQSKIVKGDKREESFCLGQLHAPSHPHMTWDQLNDPYFNIRYVIENEGKDRWFGYNENTDSCASGVAEYWK
jgi:hypothetical protein